MCWRPLNFVFKANSSSKPHFSNGSKRRTFPLLFNDYKDAFICFCFLSSFNRTCPLLYNNVFSSFYDDALQCCLQGGGHGAPDWRWVSNVEIIYLIWNWWKLISISNSCHILIKSPLLWFHQLIFVPFWSKFDQNIPASLFSSTKLETVFKPQQLFSASCPD